MLRLAKLPKTPRVVDWSHSPLLWQIQVVTEQLATAEDQRSISVPQIASTHIVHFEFGDVAYFKQEGN